VEDPEYRRDLFHGTAEHYDRFRLSYPRALVDHLLERCGHGRLLDLACGTGQVAFAMQVAFAEVWLVDQEPDMIAVARAKAEAARIGSMRFEVAAAEDLLAPEGAFDLVAIGNAYHRLRRDALAANAMRWLRPGGCLALLWSSTPWTGEAPWQRATAAVLERWREPGRVPANWDQARLKRPDRQVLAEAGFEIEGAFRFPTPQVWTLEALIGLARSTSFLPQQARFDDDLGRALGGGPFEETIDFAYELARRPTG
jgi:ubiquinone/menaquinone biosynthesis C-methylase UbiE